MTAADALARIRLIRTDGVGPVGYRQLVKRFGSAVAAVDALPDLGRRGGVALVPAEPAVAEAEIARVAAMGARHLFWRETDYPALLAATPDAPPVLVALGDVGLAQRRTVAVVGARNASAAGRALARDMAAELGAAGFAVASGMARGIDAAAHEGALATGTIACVAGGADVAYPPENEALQRAVAEQGLVLAEQPPGTEPLARHFPRRNRLIAGVSEGLVVVEAAEGSGSLITARIMGELGRDVMAVPGHPGDPRSRGGNRLIREGAALVEGAADVLAVLEPFAVAAAGPIRVRERAAEPILVAPADPEAALVALLGAAPVAVDELVRQSGLGAAAVVSLLADFELEGRIVRHAGGRVALA
jgi:DNA processing protein